MGRSGKVKTAKASKELPPFFMVLEGAGCKSSRPKKCAVHTDSTQRI